MKKVYENKSFHGFRDKKPKNSYIDKSFIKCSFEGCSISNSRDVARRTVVRNLEFINCEVRGVMIGTAIIEDVLVSGLRTHNILSAYGAVYKHVKLEGNIGQIMLRPYVLPTIITPEQETTFYLANSEYYKTVDWALDISEGRFSNCDIQAIPARLIIRDPVSQAIVTREKAKSVQWEKLDLSKTYWQTAIEFFMESKDLDMVLVAPKRSSRYADLMDGIKMLRDAGVAEPE